MEAVTLLGERNGHQPGGETGDRNQAGNCSVSGPGQKGLTKSREAAGVWFSGESSPSPTHATAAPMDL